MGESLPSLELNLPEAIEIELPDEALKLLVPEIPGNDLSFHSFDVQNIDACF